MHFEEMAQSQILDTHFRVNVGVIIINSKHQVLAFERKKIDGAWQFPQGGLDPNDKSLIAAAERELEEETAIIAKTDLKLIAQYKHWLAYEIPAKAREKKKHRMARGQVQKWFLYQILDDKMPIELAKAKDKEFKNHQWMNMEDLVAGMVEFKKPVYKKLQKWVKKQMKKR